MDVLRRMGEKFFAAYRKELKKIMLEEFVNDYINIFNYYYDTEIDKQNYKYYDRTAPTYIKESVVSYIRQSLVEGVSNMDTGKDFILRAIDDSAFVTPDRKDKDPLKLFGFYLYGTIGTYVSIEQSVFDLMYPSLEGKSLGRFGNMRLMPKHRYERLYQQRGGSSSGLPSPTDIIHPFSGAPPSRVFDLVWSDIRPKFKEYFEKAKKVALSY